MSILVLFPDYLKTLLVYNKYTKVYTYQNRQTRGREGLCFELSSYTHLYEMKIIYIL